MKNDFSTVRKLCLLLVTAMNGILLHAQSDTGMTESSTHKKYFSLGQGYMTMGYSYGLTPYALLDSSIGGYFTLEGNQQLNILKAPLNVSGRYTTLKNVSGLNNSIHVSFDAAAYREQLKQRAKQKAISYKDSILNLQNLEQQYTKRLYYLQYLSSLSPEQYANKIPSKPDADSLNIKTPESDSLKPSVAVPDLHLPELSLPSGDNYKQELTALIAKQRSALDSIRNVRSTVERLQLTADSIANLKNTQVPGAGSMPWLSRVRSFEAGLCYPAFAPLSLYGIPLRGFVTEYETNKMYFAVAAGKTISNLMFSPSLLESNMNNVRNLYNFFDFTNVESGRSIATVRLGAGKKDGNHIIAGLLWGKGLQSYWQDSTTTLNTDQTEQNLVVDIDAAFTLGKSHQFRFNYAKSVIRDNGFSNELNPEGAVRLTDARYRSHALQLKYSGVIPWTKTSVSGTLRWIDPYFRSYGAGFVRPDNMRFEIKAEQQLGKKWKVQLLARQEQNNLLGLYDQFTLLRTAGVSMSFRASRFQLRALYQPVVMQVKGDSSNFSTNNQMVNASFTWRPKTGKWKTSITGVNSYYKLLDGVINREYTNSMLLVNTLSKKGWKIGCAYALYTISPNDSLYSDNGIASIESGYASKKGWSVVVGYKLGHFPGGTIQSGYMAQASVSLWKGASLIVEGQKLIRGDYYNMYSSELFEKFPYVINTRLQLNW